MAERALKAGFQVNTHAIGDRGNRVVLDAYEQALKAVPTADHRFRVEHAQILNYDDIPRFAQLGVIPSMQASHQTSDMYWIGKRLGPTRVLGAYAWRSLINSGVVVPNGSDFPVEQVNPLISFHASIARQDANDWPAGGWFPEQRMTREEALRSMTLWPAYAAFQEKEMGSLTPGKYADFVLLDQDIMRVPAELVLKTNVIATYVGGKEVYRRQGRDAVRIVSLLPAATEIVAFLGATEHLVGVTHECNYPDIVGSRARVTKSAIPHSDDPAAHRRRGARARGPGARAVHARRGPHPRAASGPAAHPGAVRRVRGE